MVGSFVQLDFVGAIAHEVVRLPSTNDFPSE